MWKTERGVSRESVGATDASETGSGQLVSTLTPPPKSGIARAARTDYWDRYVIDVDSRARWAAETIVMVGVLYTAIYMPLQLGFGLPLVRAVDGVVTAIFCCDVMLQFFYAYVDEGFPVNSLRKCARRYASSWFVVDLVAAFPFYLMGAGLDSLQLIKTVRLLRLRRLIAKRTARSSGGNALRVVAVVAI